MTKKRKVETQPPLDTRPAMTIAQAATRLACAVVTVRRLVRDGRIQSFRIGGAGGHIRISEQALQDYLKSVEQ